MVVRVFTIVNPCTCNNTELKRIFRECVGCIVFRVCQYVRTYANSQTREFLTHALVCSTTLFDAPHAPHGHSYHEVWLLYMKIIIEGQMHGGGMSGGGGGCGGQIIGKAGIEIVLMICEMR